MIIDPFPLEENTFSLSPPVPKSIFLRDVFLFRPGPVQADAPGGGKVRGLQLQVSEPENVLKLTERS